MEVEGMPDKDWLTARDRYRYPVDLAKFAGPKEHPDWFDLKLESRCETMGFEDRFRERARHHLNAWGEVVFWKLHSTGVTRNNSTRRVLKSDVSPGQLWRACANYIEQGNLESFREFRRKLFSTPVVATAATFPAFICPERFPMVDRQVTRWAQENGHLHRYSGVNGPNLECVPDLQPGTVLNESHWPFVESWVAWCRFTAWRLRQRTGVVWRARDVEMAVFEAQRSELPLTPLA